METKTTTWRDISAWVLFAAGVVAITVDGISTAVLLARYGGQEGDPIARQLFSWLGHPQGDVAGVILRAAFIAWPALCLAQGRRWDRRGPVVFHRHSMLRFAVGRVVRSLRVEQVPLPSVQQHHHRRICQSLGLVILIGSAGWWWHTDFGNLLWWHYAAS